MPSTGTNESSVGINRANSETGTSGLAASGTATAAAAAAAAITAAAAPAGTSRSALTGATAPRRGPVRIEPREFRVPLGVDIAVSRAVCLDVRLITDLV